MESDDSRHLRKRFDLLADQIGLHFLDLGRKNLAIGALAVDHLYGTTDLWDIYFCHPQKHHARDLIRGHGGAKVADEERQ